MPTLFLCEPPFLLHNSKRYSPAIFAWLLPTVKSGFSCFANYLLSLLIHSRITVTGIYRASAVRVNPRQRSVKAVYKTHIDAVHFRKLDAKRLYEDSEDAWVCKRNVSRDTLVGSREIQGKRWKMNTFFFSFLIDRKDCHFTPERIEQLKRLSRLPDIYERLARALGEKDLLLYVYWCLLSQCLLWTWQNSGCNEFTPFCHYIQWQ